MKRKFAEVEPEAEEDSQLQSHLQYVPTADDVEALLSVMKGSIKKGIITQSNRVYLTLFNCITLGKLLEIEDLAYHRAFVLALGAKMVCEVVFYNPRPSNKRLRPQSRSQTTVPGGGGGNLSPLDLDALIEIEKKVEFKPPANIHAFPAQEYDTLVKSMKLVLYNLFHDGIHVTGTELSRRAPYYLIGLNTESKIAVASLLKIQKALECDASQIVVAHLPQKKCLQLSLKLKI